MKLKKLNYLNLILAVLWLCGGGALFVLRSKMDFVPLYFPIALTVIGLLFLFIFFEIRRLNRQWEKDGK